MVTVLDLSEVTEILPNVNNGYTLSIKVIDTKGNTVATKDLECKKLFLCAGSMGTTSLLVRSKAKGNLPGLNAEIGMNWGNNGNLMTGRNYIGTATGVNHSTIPTSGIDNWEDVLNPFFAEISPLPMNMEAWTTLYLIINKLKKTGNFYFDAASNTVKLNWDKTHTEDMVINAKKFIDKMNNANGGTIASLLFNNGIGEDICYHPLGGCVIGKATDNYGRVKGMDNLYVIDGSLIPGTIGVNPFLTITALSEYCIEHIIKTDFSGNTINELDDNVQLLQVSPNPFVDKVHIKINALAAQHSSINIYDNKARVVWSNKNAMLQQGMNNIELTGLDILSAGHYVLQVSTAAISLAEKIIKR
jgi:cholesterol oxidase